MFNLQEEKYSKETQQKVRPVMSYEYNTPKQSYTYSAKEESLASFSTSNADEFFKLWQNLSLKKEKIDFSDMQISFSEVGILLWINKKVEEQKYDEIDKLIFHFFKDEVPIRDQFTLAAMIIPSHIKDKLKHACNYIIYINQRFKAFQNSAL